MAVGFRKDTNSDEKILDHLLYKLYVNGVSLGTKLKTYS